jgi:hypothetical protein
VPVYEYEILGADGSVRGVYEVEQKMSDPPLSVHPETGAPLRRILSSTFAHGSDAKAEPCGTGACGMPAGSCGMGGCGGWN